MQKPASWLRSLVYVEMRQVQNRMDAMENLRPQLGKGLAQVQARLADPKYEFVFRPLLTSLLRSNKLAYSQISGAALQRLAAIYVRPTWV